MELSSKRMLKECLEFQDWKEQFRFGILFVKGRGIIGKLFCFSHLIPDRISAGNGG